MSSLYKQTIISVAKWKNIINIIIMQYVPY